MMNEITSRQREFAEKEKYEIERIEVELQNTLARINSEKNNLSKARIPGIGPELKRRLRRAGITTSYDVLNANRVRGIGSVKAQALSSWRQSLESRRNSAQRNAKQRRDAVQAKYRQEQNALAKNLQDFRDEFAKQCRGLNQKIGEKKRYLFERNENLTKVQQGLNAYRQVNFATYLKRILMLA